MLFDLDGLQLFADIEGVEDDNPDEGDENEGLKSLLGTEDEEQELPEEEPEETEEEETAETKTEQETEGEVKSVQQPKEEPRFTQAEVDAIIAQRLARDRKSQIVQEVEALAGMTIEQVRDYIKANVVRQKAEEMGISEQEAQRIYQQEEELRQLKAQQEFTQQQLEGQKRIMAYQRDKAKYLANPLVKRYETEIDAFAQDGMACSFEAAMNFILGQKVLSGEILSQMKSATEQKTLANIQKRSKAAPVGTATGTAKDFGLTPQERQIAKSLGISPREYAEELAKINKAKGRR